MKNELAVVDNFNLALNSETADIIAEELDGLGQIPFERVKIPSGGGLAFEVPGDDPDSPDMAKEIIGIVIDHHPINAYWAESYDGSKNPPNCSSLDAKTGTDRETGEMKACDNCPYNEFGSSGNGKACKNMIRLYILQSDSPLPMLLTLPPTSIKNWREYIGRRVVIKGYRPQHVITKITLKREQNSSGIPYSVAQFALVGLVPQEHRAELTAYRTSLQRTTRNLEIVDADYDTNPTTTGTAREAQQPHGNEDKPLEYADAPTV